MCLLRVLSVTRPIIQKDIIILRYENFSKLKDENYIRVLSSDKKGEEISKSYFYFIVNKLRQMGLLLDNAISFKVVVPYSVISKGISLKKGILYITNKKEMIFIDFCDQTYSCEKCTIFASCIPSLKQIAYELGMKITSDNPNVVWYKVIESIQQTLLESSVSLRLKLNEIPFSEKVCCQEEVEENELRANI